MKSETGFTLIELIVTVAIAAIVLGIGLPMMSSFARDTRMASRTNELVTALNYARTEAVERGEFVSLCPSSDEASCTGNTDWTVGWIVWEDEVGAGDGDVDGGETILRIGESSTNMTIDTNVSSITYESGGSLNGGAGVTFELTPDQCDGDDKREIDINLSGRPRASQVSCP